MCCFSVVHVVFEQDKLLNSSPVLCNGKTKGTKSFESIVTCQKADFVELSQQLVSYLGGTLVNLKLRLSIW